MLRAERASREMSAARAAVVFAYHDVGVRCLKTLLSAEVEVPLVVTVADDPNETQWFASVADTAREYGLPVVMPDDANTPELAQRVAQLQPDFIFSFYYRSMLGAPLLRTRAAALSTCTARCCRSIAAARRSTGRSCTASGETGATLHYMVERADAGDIVDQLAVPILEDDDAREVFGKVTVAAEIILARSLPGLIAGDAPRRPQPIEPGQYFGRRRPEDGRIDWSLPAVRIHNLVRAVAPPFPGAFTEVDGQRWWIHKTRVEPRTITPSERARLFGSRASCYVACRDGSVLRIVAAATEDGPVDLARVARDLEAHPAVAGSALSTIALKIDVDTYRGTREGVPRLAAALRAGGRAGDLSLQRRPRSYGQGDQAGVSPRIHRQGAANLGVATLRLTGRCCTGCCSRGRTSADVAGRSCARSRSRASRSACTPTITSSGRTAWRGPASRGHGGSSRWRVMSLRVFVAHARGARRRGLAGQWQRPGSGAGVGVSLCLGYAGLVSVHARGWRERR